VDRQGRYGSDRSDQRKTTARSSWRGGFEALGKALAIDGAAGVRFSLV
jgi:hypothetical protein